MEPDHLPVIRHHLKEEWVPWYSEGRAPVILHKFWFQAEYQFHTSGQGNNHEKQQALTENREYHISNIHPHLFRHTFITLCYEFHMDPASIMLISGHNDIDMMKHYTHPDSVFINSEFNKYTDYMHKYLFRSNATIDQDLQIWSKDGQISIPQTLKPL